MFKKHALIALCFFVFIVVSCGKIKHEEKSKIEVMTKNGEITSIHDNRKISGIYPHLTTYAHGRIDGTYGFGNECGIGALAVWNNKLYMLNYAAHQPKGSEHKLYIVDEDMNMQIFEGSIGGTPAARMVHQESNQLFIGPYAIDSIGQVRVIPYTDMEGRLTAIGRHLKDPENMVYYYDMEGMLYEVNVHTLEVNKLFHDPLPGWHGKGGYTSQGRFVVSNNGEHASEGRVTHDDDNWESEHYKWMDSWKIEKDNVFGPENLGILAEFDGDNFKVVERRQYTDVTTKHGIYAIPNDQSPLWAMGWDNKSVRLKVLDQGEWYTYLLPKATYNNDPPHGWFTEWPRIRSVGNGKMMMDMHGMFFDFPETFSAANTAGIKPMGSHLRYIPDFVNWNGQIVLATDETSIHGNPLSGQPQSNLWFGSYEQLSNWGPASGYGAIWLKEEVSANKPSDQFLISGFHNRMVHFKNHTDKPVKITMEIDKNGDNNWIKLKDIDLEAGNYKYYIFDTSLKAEWLRLIPETSLKVTASVHLTDSNLKDASEGKELFSALADIDYSGKVNHAKLYTNKTNFNLSVYNGTIENGQFNKTNELEFTKFNFNFIENITDSNSVKALKMKNIWSEDEASIILNAKNYRLRLPKGNGNYSEIMPSGTARVVREIESERELANIGGTFYELPLFKVGQEPRYKMMRPVSTHGKQISEFNTWNGLLVLSGVKKEAKASENVYVSEDGEASLWFGGIDDIWSFGKPIGEGGPWKNSKVKANELSDMYLMTGYDKKALTLKVDKDAEITLLIHINHYLDEPVEYKTFSLKAGETFEHKFPDGFSAHWIQLKTNKDCTATAWFVYE
ncbi:hypothetical protein [Snuella sedimenti]|uniref:Uncharacterized protein n=1 Tax=Snuella sedimenti TaxID=2798802 RepID=A0A8J7ISB8_9FLAO|nr:hypothetical protein [Snuella sedimenti]MBJ6366995.1 hypothetical protein [Snuella sedimenti]